MVAALLRQERLGVGPFGRLVVLGPCLLSWAIVALVARYGVSGDDWAGFYRVDSETPEVLIRDPEVRDVACMLSLLLLHGCLLLSLVNLILELHECLALLWPHVCWLRELRVIHVILLLH